MAWKLTGALKRQPRIPADQRIYAIGDVHGRADLLTDVFGQIDSDLKARPIETSVQVFLGDYIDRGPHSRQVMIFAGLAGRVGRSQTAQMPAGRRCRTRPQPGQGRLSAARAAFR